MLLVINVGTVSAYCKLFPHRRLWVRHIVPDRKPLESNRGKKNNELQSLRKCKVNFRNAFQMIYISNTVHSSVLRQGTNLNLLLTQNGATVPC